MVSFFIVRRFFLLSSSLFPNLFVYIILMQCLSRDCPLTALTMHCYYCHLLDDALHLNEHEAARWLGMDELDSVSWLPADVMVVNEMKKE